MLPEEVIKQAIEESDVPHYLEKLIESKPYQLSPEVEQVMASLSPTFQSAYELYGTTKMLDIAFESFEHNNVTYLWITQHLKMNTRIMLIQNLDKKVLKALVML